MSKIIRLDESTINQIAAGEVVERPASVVKELVENALDAGSRSIVVEIAGGGREMVRVTDDGSGMDREDALLSLERHATSKIRTIGDIAISGSLGFRGEALPSIASVSRVEIITRTRTEDAGTRIVAEGGMVVSCEEYGARPGTQVAVRDLFYNTPARMKFLKNAATETARAVSTAVEASLSAPDVRFSVVVDGKEVARTPGSGSLSDVIVGLYGTEFARSLVQISFEAQGIEVSGYASRPSLSRASRREQHFLVLGRPVRDQNIRWALEEAYSGNMARGRYPVAFINIVVNREDVDVNVHPAKAEVRFRDEGAVKRAVLVAVSRALVAAGESAAHSQDAVYRAGPDQPRAAGEGPAGMYGRMPGESAGAGTGQRAGYGRHGARQDQPGAWPSQAGAAGQVFEEFRKKGGGLAANLGSLVPIGQVLGTYVVAEYPGGLALVDQHAAHERINFERIRAAVSAHRSQSQPLLVPVTFEPGPAERSVLREYLGTLSELGFEVEEFGAGTWIVRSCVIVNGVEVRLQDVLDRLVHEQPIAVEDWPGHKAAVALAACVASVKAGQRLDLNAQAALLRELAETQEPLRCPHGRPTIVVFGQDDIERRFGRR